MRFLTISLLAIALASSVSAQQKGTASSVSAGATAFNSGPNLPEEKIGRDDLLGITVYDSPELTRTVRVDADGNIRLPILKQHIQAVGLLPVELESAITTALVDENVLVDPIVTVSVVEYHSRPITVVGAVRNPTTFQATGTVTLLDAISQAGGLTENAGSEILVSHPPSTTNGTSVTLTERIPVHALLDVADPASNLKLEGGENIRVPEAGRIYVLGRVKHPGTFLITNGSESSVLKALSLSEGLDTYPGRIAYIYRTEGASSGRNEIPIDLKKIMDRKSPDVPLMADDILYIPDATGRRAALSALDRTLVFGSAAALALLYIYR